MSGGLLQIASYGLEDIYLTKNPEITFFKKVYRRHTNFSTEIKKIALEQIPSFGEEFTVRIPNYGDLLNQCFFEVDLPFFKIFDKDLPNTAKFSYESIKIKKIDELQLEIDKFEELYNKLEIYSNIEFKVCQFANILLAPDELNISEFKIYINEIYENFFNEEREKIKNEIDENIFKNVDIKKYVENLDENVSSEEIKNQLDKKLNYLLDNLKYYHSNKEYYKEKLEELSIGELNYNWVEYIGHNFFEFIEIEIGGILIDRFTKERLHIFQMHHIDENKMDNYLNMIGHNEELYMYYKKKKNSYKLYIPLIFWFCKDSLNSLPIVAMQYSDIVIRAKIEPLKNLLFFKNLDELFKKFTTIDLPLEKTNNKFILNSELNYDRYEILKDVRKVRYYCNNINENLLKLKISNISQSEVNNILSFSKNSFMEKNDFYKLARSYFNNTFSFTDSKNLIRFELFGISYFLDSSGYEFLYSIVPEPEISFLGEFIYLDEIEREKFSSSNLEYIIEIFNENSFNLGNDILFSNELDFTDPSKELIWFVELKGLSDGKDLYDNTKFLDFKIPDNFINSFNIYFSKEEMFYQKNVFNDNYYKFVAPYSYLNNMLPEGVYYKNFCLYPEKIQPSGSLNFSHLTGKTIRIEFNNDFLDFYFNINNNYLKKSFKITFLTKSYNIFKVSKGIGQVII